MKNQLRFRPAALAAAVLMLLSLFCFAGCGGSDKSSSSQAPGLTVITASDSSAATPAATAAQTETTSAAESEESAPVADDSSKEYKQYSFRSKKLFDDHYKKHGSEFGSISQEEYLQLANDLLNSDSPTVLHKTEKEDGDDVYFDTDTGYFLVLSTDGYIRTFFIPDKGIAYYNKQ